MPPIMDKCRTIFKEPNRMKSFYIKERTTVKFGGSKLKIKSKTKFMSNKGHLINSIYVIGHL